MPRCGPTITWVVVAALLLPVLTHGEAYEAHIAEHDEVGGLSWDALLYDEHCNQTFHVDMAINDQCAPASVQWTFSGCGAEPGASTEFSPMVSFHQPGVCQITFHGEDACGNTWDGSATFYVVGGPFDVTLEYAPRLRDDLIGDTSPWYLNFFDYAPSPGGIEPADGRQLTVKAKLTAKYPQPAYSDGSKTEYWWTIVGPAVLVGPYSANDCAAAKRITLRANGPSTLGGVTVYLSYVLTTSKGTFGFGDDTEWTHPKGTYKPNWRKFTSHRPTAVTDERIDEAAREVGAFFYYDYYYYEVEDQHGMLVPHLRVQERFPNGTGASFLWNGLTGATWTTDLAGEFGWDKIGCGGPAPWTRADHPDQPVFDLAPHQYFGGTHNTSSGAVGVHLQPDFRIRTWTDAAEHIPL